MADDYITLEDLADYMDVEVLLLHPAELAIASAQAVVRNYLQQEITYVPDDSVVLDGSGTEILRLPERPVIDVTLLTEDGSEIDPDTYTVRGADIIRTDYACWYSGLARYVVTYSHGWAAPEDLTSEGPDVVPADIRLVTLGAARRAYQSLGEEGEGGEQTEQIGAYSYTKAKDQESEATELLKAEIRVLSPYKVRKVP